MKIDNISSPKQTRADLRQRIEAAYSGIVARRLASLPVGAETHEAREVGLAKCFMALAGTPKGLCVKIAPGAWLGLGDVGITELRRLSAELAAYEAIGLLP